MPSTFSELLRLPGVEERARHRSSVGFLALHGGLEAATAEIAEAAADRAGASWYAVVQPSGLRAHVQSHRFDAASSPVLRSFLDHCDVVISLHGFGREGLWTSLLVGGRDRTMASALATRLRDALPGYEVVDDVGRIPPPLRGLDPRNPVNAARRGGVQLELPPRVRGMGPFWGEDDDAHERRVGFRPHTEALVAALAAFALDALG